MKLIECPRDAMQGLSSFIPTIYKIKYLNQLLKVGFDTIDIGSFVSKRQIPQLSDTAEVLNNYDGIILATDHDYFDYELIKNNSKMIIDTRGRFKPLDNIIRA